MACPDFAELLNYCDGRTNDDAQLVAAHLSSGCRRCLEEVGWYERVCAIAASDSCKDPPAWVFKRALQLFETVAQPRADRFDRFAALVFDSLARPVLAGVRLAETSSRQMLYRAGVHSIDVQITFPGPSGADLMGQILLDSEFQFESVSGLLIQVAHQGQAVCATVTNAVGEFTLHDIAHNEYDLSIETKEGVIIVPRLPVTPYES
jgi:hypothetical protein